MTSWLKRISGPGLVGRGPGFAAGTPRLPAGEPTDDPTGEPGVAGIPGVGRGMELIPDCKAPEERRRKMILLFHARTMAAEKP